MREILRFAFLVFSIPLASALPLREAMAKTLIEWIRDVEAQAHFRSYVSNIPAERITHRLDDIADARPLVVGTPAESYDLLYGDATYSAFRARYRHRRPMIYVSTNGDAFHAFGRGFYLSQLADVDSSSKSHTTLLRRLPHGLALGSPAAVDANDEAMGQDVRRVVRGNALPGKRYTPVFSGDSSTVASDVQLWGDGASGTCQKGASGPGDVDAQGHVCGWGTVMVMPFRLRADRVDAETMTMGSASEVHVPSTTYAIVDITNPELPPTVLGEITTGIYAHSAPAFAMHRETDGRRHFLLAVGSGSAMEGDANRASSPVSAGSQLSVWVYDLERIKEGSLAPVASFTGAQGGPVSSVAGDMVASDFDLNGSAEGIYFGVATHPSAPSVAGGGLWEIDLRRGTSDISDPGDWRLHQVIDTGTPITARPVLGVDALRRPMIFVGSDPRFTAANNAEVTEQGSRLYVYGVTDNSLLASLPSVCQRLPINPHALFDSSTAAVYADGTVQVRGMPGVGTFEHLQTTLAATDRAGCYVYAGWRMALAAQGGSSHGPGPKGEAVTRQILLDGWLLTSTNTPNGASHVYVQNYLTGTADPRVRAASASTKDKPEAVANMTRDSVAGDNGNTARSPAPTSEQNQQKPLSILACSPPSDGLPCSGPPSFKHVQSGEISWRETDQ